MKETSYYTKTFYDEMQGNSYSSAKIILAIVNDLVHPLSVIDVGCGTGGWLKVWQDDYHIKNIRGYEGPYLAKSLLQIDKEKIIFHDLKFPIVNEQKYDLAMSLEVAEHLPEHLADQFVQNLTTLSDVVLFSAAIIGQEGTYHINEQMPEYWAAKFDQHDYLPFDCIRPSVWNNAEVVGWYQQNSILYVKKNTALFTYMISRYPVADKNNLLRIHPNTYLHKVKMVEKTSTLPKFIYYKGSMIKKRIFKYFNL